MSVDNDLFRSVMGNFPAGVTIVTATTKSGQPRGLTVSAFSSVSMTPPLVLVCVDRSSTTLSAIRASEGFTVNFLASGRSDLAMRFASKTLDKFEGVSWRPSPIPEGGPILEEDCCAYSVCKVIHALKAGDHWVFVGQVEEGGLWEDRLPLAYCRRTFMGWPSEDTPLEPV